MSYPRYTGGASNQTSFAPLPMLEYKEIVYIEPLRAGARLWHSDDGALIFGLAARVRFGFRAKDGVRLTGMQTRHDAIEGGVSAEWRPSEWSFGVDYFTDGSDVNDGRSFRLSIFRQLMDSEHWDVGTYLDFDHIDSRIARYYFGVRANEATATRPVYQPDATTNSSFGFSGAYKLNKTYAILFSSEVGVLGTSAAKSPIVQQRTGFISYFGLGLVF